MSGLSYRLPFFSGAAMALAGAVAWQALLFNQNSLLFYSQQPTSPLVVLGFYALVAISAALAAGGVVGLSRRKPGDSGTPSSGRNLRWERLAYSALVGLSLTLLSFFYIGGIGFENEQRGFPLLFAFRVCLNGCGPFRLESLPALLDCGFWLAMGYLFVAGVSLRSRVARGYFEWLVGVGLAFFSSFMAVGIIVDAFGAPYTNLAWIPFFLFFNAAIGYVQVKRSFRVMGWTIIGMGIVLSATVLILG